jgi:hypothetical protein
MIFRILILLLIGIASAPAASEPLKLSWTNNMLTISAPWFPGEKIDVWHMEAFCRPGSTKRDWHDTVIPHKTTLVSANSKGDLLKLRTMIEPGVECLHEIRSTSDEVTFTYKLRNFGLSEVDMEWFQPGCIRVGKFTGLDQSNYIQRSFIFTDKGLTFLDKMPRAEEAVYRGGQVYVPAGINLKDVNPRPISSVKPANGLIGCVSGDNKYLLATASDATHELFQGVIVCLHSDPHIGGLKRGATKSIQQKIYILKNDPELLLTRYKRDFGR